MGGKPRPINRITTLAEVLSWPEVKALRAQMDDYLDLDEEQRVIVWDSDTNINGDFHLDYDHYKVSDFGIRFFVIRGDLHVDGSIINTEGDYGIGILVLGNIIAKNAIFGGSQGMIDGDIGLSGYGLSRYNHGTVISTGTVSARALINHDNRFPGKPVHGVQVLEWGGKGEYALSEHLIPEFVEDDYPDVDLMIAAILNGQPFLNEKKPKTKFEEIRWAVEAWKERKVATPEFSLCGFTRKKFPKQLVELTCIESLDVSGTKCSYPAALGKLTKLRKLVAQEMDMGLLSEALVTLPRLRELDIEGSYSITSPKVLRALSSLRELRVLRVKDATGELLKLFPALEILETRTMETAVHSSQLRELKLLGARTLPLKVDQLASSLEVFEFRQHAWESPDPKTTPVPTFSEFSKLHNVTLYGSYNLKHGMQVRYLESLFLAPKLRTLNLVGWNCSSSEFEGLDQLKSLRTLEIVEAELHAAPKGLEKLTGLRSLNLQGNLLRATAKKALSKALPHTEIIFEKGKVVVNKPSLTMADGALLIDEELESILEMVGNGSNDYLGEHKLDNSESQVLCFDGHVRVEGDLDLSAINGTDSMAIAGDLVVSGNIIASKGTLVVGGTTEARNIITTGGELFFYGSVDATWILVLGSTAKMQVHQPMAANSCLVDVGQEEDKLGVSDFACDSLFVVSPLHALDRQGSVVGNMIQGVSRVLSLVRPEFLNSGGALDSDAVVNAICLGDDIFGAEPARPVGIPTAAIWSAVLFQWELGDASLVNVEKDDTQSGTFSEWRFPGGYLAKRICCTLEDSIHRRVEQTFHPNGELATSTTWIGNHKSQEIYNRTQGELGDNFYIPYYYKSEPEIRQVTVNFPKEGNKQVSYDYWRSEASDS